MMERLGHNEDNFRRREIRLVTVDECPFGEERHHGARRDVAFYLRVGILTDLTAPFPFFEDLFYCTVYTDLLSRNRFCEALRGICPRD